MSYLAISQAGKKLYYKGLAGTFSAFPVQPPATVQSYWAVALPNGTIIVKGATDYLHFNPDTCLWSSFAAPDANEVRAAWVVSNTCVIAATATTALHLFNGTVWSAITPALPAACVGGPVAFSDADIWCLTGGKHIYHLEAGAWVDRWSTACAALAGGADIGPIVNIFAVGTTLYFCGNPTASTGRVFKLTGGVGGTWAWLGAAFDCVPCHISGPDEANLRVLGYLEV